MLGTYLMSFLAASFAALSAISLIYTVNHLDPPVDPPARR